MADTINFPQKLHSTRRDHKLVDAAEIDGQIQRAQLADDAQGGELTGLRLVADLRIDGGTQQVIEGYPIVDGQADRDLLFEAVGSPSSAWTIEDHNDIYDNRTSGSPGAFRSGAVQFWKNPQDQLVVRAVSADQHVRVWEVRSRLVLTDLIERFVRTLPGGGASNEGDVVRVAANGDWQRVTPRWSVAELATAVQGRLLPAPSVANAGKVPTVNSAGSAYVFEESGAAEIATSGLRVESVEFQPLSESAYAQQELLPIATNPVVVVHGDGDPVLITGISGTDFRVAAGLYLVTIDAEFDGGAVAMADFDFRDSSDNSVIAGPTGFTTYNTNGVWLEVTVSGYLHLSQDTLINLAFDTHGRAVGLRNTVMRLAQLSVEDRAHILRVTEPLDTDRARAGDIVLSERAFYQLSTASDEDLFAGEAEVWDDGGAGYVGTASGPNRFGSRGRFTANPDFAIAALTGGGDNQATVAVRIKKTVYETAKGSAVASGDTVILEITADGSTTRTTVTYIRTEDDLVAFLAHDADSALHDLDDGDTWTMRVLSAYDAQTQTGTPLLTHSAGAAHFNQYPVDGVDKMAREALSPMVAFFAAVKPWEFDEPVGGIGFREVGRTAGETRDEAITGELDPDQELVAALRVTEEYELDRTLRLQCTIGYFLRKTQGITTSGAVGSVQVSLAVQRAGAADRVLRQLHAATFTLDQFNAQYAGVGNALRYSDTADVTHAVDESWTDFSNFNLQKGDLLVFHFRANAINGNALVKIEMQDLEITLTKGL